MTNNKVNTCTLLLFVCLLPVFLSVAQQQQKPNILLLLTENPSFENPPFTDRENDTTRWDAHLKHLMEVHESNKKTEELSDEQERVLPTANCQLLIPYLTIKTL